ncbi:C-GCAxxG-C-C family (seleno)protein [candidate division KSB1 bacterium]
MKMNRRRFLRVSAAGAAAAGAATLLVNSNWLFAEIYPGDTKKIFAKCGACSQTFFCLLNREFGHPKKTEELASDPLAGGLMNSQHQCGMLWGSALAAGAESFRRFNDSNQAINKAITSTQNIVESFSKRAKTVNCRDLIGFDFSNKFNEVKLMLNSLPGGFSNVICMNLAEKWAPEAIQSAKEGLTSKQTDLPQLPLSCASEVAKKMGANDEEMVMVSGLAGGIGLSGHACGALGAAIWISSLEWCKKHPGKSGYSNPNLKEILKAFNDETGSEFLCHKISGQCFKTIKDHTEFVKNGGCDKLINVLAHSN